MNDAWSFCLTAALGRPALSPRVVCACAGPGAGRPLADAVVCVCSLRPGSDLLRPRHRLVVPAVESVVPE